MNAAQCAHSKVVLKHHDYPDGTRSDYWECDSGCGKQFWPEHVDMNIRNLRDYFAAVALQGISSQYPWFGKGDPDSAAALLSGVGASAYKLADAMLAERAKD